MVEATKNVSPTLRRLERKGKNIENLPLIQQYLAKCAIAKEQGAPGEAKTLAKLAVYEAVTAVRDGRKIGACLPKRPIWEIIDWQDDAVGGTISYNLSRKTVDALADDILRYDFFNHPFVSVVLRKLSIIKGSPLLKADWWTPDKSEAQGSAHKMFGKVLAEDSGKEALTQVVGKLTSQQAAALFEKFKDSALRVRKNGASPLLESSDIAGYAEKQGIALDSVNSLGLMTAFVKHYRE